MDGCDAHLPTATEITASTEREFFDLCDFGKSLMTNLSEAREDTRAFRIHKRSRNRSMIKEPEPVFS